MQLSVHGSFDLNLQSPIITSLVNSKVPESNQPCIQAMHGLSVKDVPSVDSAEFIFGIEELGDSAKNP